MLDEQEHLLVYNKIDVSDKRPSGFDLFVSAKEMDGLGALRKTLDEKLSVDKGEKDLTYLVRERHVNIFSEVSSRLDLISSSIKANESLDVVAENGGKAANFLDIGGGAKAETVSSALEVLEADQNVKSVLINIFGGITRCDLVAEGIIEATKGKELVWPIIIRLDGTNSLEGLEILRANPNEKYS